MSVYPFDPTGKNPQNRVVNERHTIGSWNGVDGYLIVPEFAPYFRDSLSVFNEDTGLFLSPGTDYLYTHPWDIASNWFFGEPGEVFGTVYLLPHLTISSCLITYQTVGGDWAEYKPSHIVEGLVSQNDIIGVDWDTSPVSFPIRPHSHSLSGLVGMTDVINELSLLRQTLEELPKPISLEDVQDIDTRFIDPLLQAIYSVREAFLNYLTQESLQRIAKNEDDIRLIKKAVNDLWYQVFGPSVAPPFPD